jgi:hypothetical protein
MTNVLHLPARPDAPIACDMTAATDTPDDRLAEYGRLFERALVRRERREHSVVFAFRTLPETQATVESLARREAACCPFLDYRVDTTEHEVIFAITNPIGGSEGADVDAMLDTLYALPDHASSDLDGLVDRFADGGVDVVEAGTDRWELRRSAGA